MTLIFKEEVPKSHQRCGTAAQQYDNDSFSSEKSSVTDQSLSVSEFGVLAIKIKAAKNYNETNLLTTLL